MAVASKAESTEISVMEINTGRMEIYIVGTTPIICNRMSEKAMRELLAPAGKKTAAEKSSTLKHHPLEEFRASPYVLPDDDSPTLIAGLSTWFKRSMMSAALDMPGAKKTQIGRLTWVEGQRVPVYGVPQIFSAIVRSADMARTPDVRTRCIIPQWACSVTICFVKPALREKSVLNLLAAAGMTIGVGDWRNEKGSANYGSYRLTTPDDPEYQAIVASGGRAVQKAALADPVAYDDETSELLAWYNTEVKRRGFKVAA